MHAKDFHASIKDLHICANNPALEDFVIQNHCKQFLRTYAKTRICVCAQIIQRWKTFLSKISRTYEKKTAKSLLRPCFAYICANNPALEDSVIQNHY